MSTATLPVLSRSNNPDAKLVPSEGDRYCEICDSYRPADGGEDRPDSVQVPGAPLSTTWICAACAIDCPA